MSKKQKIVLIFIVLAALLLRTVSLDRIPPSLSNDEISIAYDAYSVSLTGRDEHNAYLPLSFKSHSTYKAPLAIYLSVPPVKILGTSEYATRLPSAILGMLTVLMIGLIVYRLTGNPPLTLLSAFLLAITPWHIYTSRMALESNIALFFVALGVWLFHLGLERKIFMPLSFSSFALSLYGYHTEWVFTPLLIFSLLLLKFRSLPLKTTVLSLLMFLILLLPLALDYIKNLQSTTRANTEGFIYEESLQRTLNDPSASFFSKGRLLTLNVFDNYTSYLDPAYLFINGLGIPTPATPIKAGLFLIITLPGFIIGLIRLRSFFKEHALFIYSWALLAPLVPALTKGGLNHVRELVAVLPYTLIISAGTLAIWRSFGNRRWMKTGFLTLFGISFLYFFLLYFIHFPIESGEGYQYGYRQIAGYLKIQGSAYQQVVVDPWFGDAHQFRGVPHLYLSYFTGLDPAKFLRERTATEESLFYDRYQIRYINWNAEKVAPKTLYVVPTSNLPNAEKLKMLGPVFSVSLPNGKPAFSLYTAQPAQ